MISVTKSVGAADEPVYNVLGYNFNVVANNMIVSSHGEITKDVPEIVYSAGQLIYNWIGAEASKRFYKTMGSLL